MINFGCGLVLAAVPGHENDASEDDQKDVNTVDDNMNQEAWKISWRVLFLEDLRCNQIANCPSNENHGHDNTLLGLAGNVAGDERDDHVALSKEELSAIKGNEHATGVGQGWLDDKNDNSSDYGGDGPQLGDISACVEHGRRETYDHNETCLSRLLRCLS